MDLFLALSVHRFVTSVGAYAGFAAIVGLAILILLFFAQARETNALRDHVDELLERIGGLESRVARQAQAHATAQEAAAQAAARPEPARAALAAVGGARMPSLALPPAPPAGVGAPALSAATRVIPLSGTAIAGTRGDGGSGGGGVATAPGPATPAGANGASHAAPAAADNGPAPSGPRPVGVPNRSTATSASRPGAAPATAAANRRPSGRPAPSARPQTPGRFSRGRGRVALILGLLVAVAAVAAAIVLMSSKSSKQPTNSVASHQTTQRVSNSTAQINPRTVTVAVLNGTATAGLAHRTSQRLVTMGYVKGAVTTAADQTRTSTTVAYIPGARAQALAVAKALKLGSASVAPVDQGTRTVACGGSATCTASVFVTVGSDLANQ